MKKFKVEYKFRCDSGVVYWVETAWIDPDLRAVKCTLRHAAEIEAMNILLSMADELKLGHKKLEDYKIVWEE